MTDRRALPEPQSDTRRPLPDGYRAGQAAPLIDVRLHGPLGDKYGRRFRFKARTPRECIRAIEANFPGFRGDFLAQGEWALLVDGEWRPGEIAPGMPCSKRVDICPVINGQAFLGALLITALIPGISAAAANIIGGLLVAGLLIGVSMFLTPKAKKLQRDDGKRDESYGFSGPDNIIGQGAAVPLAYGRVFAGSVVVSASLTTEDIPIGSSSTRAAGLALPQASRLERVAGAGQDPAIVDHWRGQVLVPGPAGWLYVGEQTILAARQKLVMPLWVSPDGARTWDQVRGFLSRREGWQ